METQNLSTSNFNKFFKFICTLLVLTTGLGLFFNLVFERYIIFSSEISGASKINRMITENHQNEIPILGSSRAEGSYIPSILGESYYNYGISGTQAFIWLYFLEKELDKNKTSDIVINFDLGGFHYSNGDVGNYIPNYPETKKLMLEEEVFYYNFPFVKYFGEFEKYIKYSLNERMNLTKYTDNGGSFEKNILTDKKFQELVKKREQSKASFIIDDELLDKFKYLLSSTERNINIVIAPYHSSYFNKFNNIEEANIFLIGLGKMQNVHVWDLRQSINKDSLFMNTTHINYQGAQIFSKKLKELIAEKKNQSTTTK